MSFEQSPSLSDYKDGLPEELPTPPDRRKPVRITLLVFLVLVLILTTANFFKSQTGNFLLGKGAVEGRAVDEKGAPFIGDVFIVGMDPILHTDSDGHFLLESVPAGTQSLVVADKTTGQMYPIVVIPGQTINVGEIKFATTAMPRQ